jgi:hypothetical protein
VEVNTSRSYHDINNDTVIHLFKFHFHIRKLRVKFPEYCLMKMFMETLEDKSRSWYEGLPSTGLCSLNDFHTVFYEHFKEFCLPLPWAETYCAYCWSPIQIWGQIHVP